MVEREGSYAWRKSLEKEHRDEVYIGTDLLITTDEIQLIQFCGIDGRDMRLGYLTLYNISDVEPMLEGC